VRHTAEYHRSYASSAGNLTLDLEPEDSHASFYPDQLLWASFHLNFTVIKLVSCKLREDLNLGLLVNTEILPAVENQIPGGSFSSF
jgi:hypothetical protein